MIPYLRKILFLIALICVCLSVSLSFAQLPGNALVQFGPRHGNHNDVFDGFINEARIYNGALDAGEIGDIFVAGPVPEPGTGVLLMLGLSLIFGSRSVRRRAIA